MPRSWKIWQEGIRKGRGWNIQQKFNRALLYSFEAATTDELKRLHSCPEEIKEKATIMKELKYNVFR